MNDQEATKRGRVSKKQLSQFCKLSKEKIIITKRIIRMIKHTIYSMNKTRLHGDEEYQYQHYSPRDFSKSPCNCGHNQYLGLLLHCDYMICRHKLH